MFCEQTPARTKAQFHPVCNLANNTFYQNVRGLRTKADESMSNLIVSNHDIICLSETWLCSGIPDANSFIPKYNILISSR
uniref:Putative reverse transcriptase n=1 Tax=Ixodes ricinus TaxID=34613 RepID=A0A6B0U685_IXORI